MTMLRHLKEAPALPCPAEPSSSALRASSVARLMRRLEAAGAAALDLTRKEVDLLAPDAADKLAVLLIPGDAVLPSPISRTPSSPKDLPRRNAK
jgi:hypothetical protein